MAVMLGMHVQSITPSIIVPIDSPEEAPVVAGAAVVGAAVVGGAVVVGATSVAKRQKIFGTIFFLLTIRDGCLLWHVLVCPGLVRHINTHPCLLVIIKVKVKVAEL